MGEATSPVAIIIPCYNGGEFLRAAVDSALAQSYQNIECIVVDDGSTDTATKTALESVAALDRVRVVVTDNQGLPSARNNGISATDATYFLPLDADDVIDPSYVEEAVAVMETDPAIGIVYCRARLFGDVNEPWGLAPFSYDVILVDNLIFATALFRRKDWQAVGGYDAAMVHGREDHDFNLKVLGLGRTAHRLDGEYFAYRQHGESLKDVIGQSRAQLVASSARVMRNNIALYSEHADDLFEYIYLQRDAINDFRHRYETLERMRNRFPRVLKAVSRTARAIHGTGNTVPEPTMAPSPAAMTGQHKRIWRRLYAFFADRDRPLYQVRKRAQVCLRFRIPLTSHIFAITERAVITRIGHDTLLKTYDATIDGRERWNAERLAEAEFGRERWKMPVYSWTTKGLVMPRFRESDRLDRVAPVLDKDTRLSIGVELLRIILTIYDAGYAHRDIKASNLYWREGDLYLTDYESFTHRHDSRAFLESFDITGTGIGLVAGETRGAFGPQPNNIPDTLEVDLPELLNMLEATLEQEHHRGNEDSARLLTVLRGVPVARGA